MLLPYKGYQIVPSKAFLWEVPIVFRLVGVYQLSATTLYLVIPLSEMRVSIPRLEMCR